MKPRGFAPTLAGSNRELQKLSNKLDVATAGAYGMEIRTVKSKVMVNSTSVIVDGEQPKEISSFKSRVSNHNGVSLL